MNELTLEVEVTGGDSISFDGAVRIAGHTVWTITLTNVGRGAHTEAEQAAAVTEAFASHLSEVLNRF